MCFFLFSLFLRLYEKVFSFRRWFRQGVLVFWIMGPLGLGGMVVLFGSRSFAWELGKVRYGRSCTARLPGDFGGVILFQHNNVVKQSTVKA